MTGWGKVKAAAKHAGVSERTLRDWLKEGLKHSRLPSGTILIRYEDVDTYLESFATTSNEVDRLLDELMKK